MKLIDMKFNRSTAWAFLLILVIASVYRVWEGRPFGFAPQMALALFGGAIIKDKRLAFILPIFSLLLSDILYEVLYMNGLTDIRGFYPGQWAMYLIFAGITLFGMLMRKINVVNVFLFTLSGGVLFFLASNLSVWLAGEGLRRPKTFSGLMQCYGDALAFYRDYGVIKGFAGNQLIGDLFFSAILFGGYYLVRSVLLKPATQKA
jgi:hypothetical protein